MTSLTKKQEIITWIQELNDDALLEKLIRFQKNAVSDFENELIQKGLDDILKNNVSNHEEVKKRFELKFSK